MILPRWSRCSIRSPARLTSSQPTGAYDGKPTYQMILQHSSTANVVIPPRSTAVESGEPDRLVNATSIIAIASDGRLRWQAVTGYGKRALVETAIGRYKALIGRRLRARSFAAQQTEVAIGCIVQERGIERHIPRSRQVRAQRRQLRTGRLHLRSQARSLHLPRRERTQAAPKGLLDAAPSR